MIILQTNFIWRYAHLDIARIERLEDSEISVLEIKEHCARCEARVGYREHQGWKAVIRKKVRCD